MPEIIPIPDEGLGNHSYLVELGDHRALYAVVVIEIDATHIFVNEPLHQ